VDRVPERRIGLRGLDLRMFTGILRGQINILTGFDLIVLYQPLETLPMAATPQTGAEGISSSHYFEIF
jgi:hypothetical protein